ncbi:flagellar hook-length control protein FliK [bacterium]|nr:flagellar hook-length control protein FliK [bacterium]
MNILPENLEQISNLFTIANSQKSNLKGCAVVAVDAFSNVLDKINTMNNDAKKIEKDLNKKLIDNITKTTKEVNTNKKEKTESKDIVNDEKKALVENSIKKTKRSENNSEINKTDTKISDKKSNVSNESNLTKTRLIDANKEDIDTRTQERAAAITEEVSTNSVSDSADIEFQINDIEKVADETSETVTIFSQTEDVNASQYNILNAELNKTNVASSSAESLTTETNAIEELLTKISTNSAETNSSIAIVDTKSTTNLGNQLDETEATSNEFAQKTSNILQNNMLEVETDEAQTLSLNDLELENIETEVVSGETTIETNVENKEATTEINTDGKVKTNTEDKIEIETEIKDNSELIEDMIEEVDVDIDADTEINNQQTQNKASIKENISETLLKAQISSVAPVQEKLNTQTNNINSIQQLDIKDALSSQVANVQTVDTETASQNNLNLTQDNSSAQTKVQSSQGNNQSIDGVQFNGEISKLAKSTNVQTQNNTQAPTKADVLNQVTTKFEQLKDGTTTKVNIILKPENLGKVSVELISRPEGISAKILADTTQVKEILDKSIDTLKNSLQTQGVNVNNISVKVVEGAQGSELSFSQNFDFTNQENQQKNERLSADTNSDFQNKEYNDEETELNNFYNHEEEINPELEVAEKLYSQHSGKVDLMV